MSNDAKSVNIDVALCYYVTAVVMKAENDVLTKLWL